MSKEQFVYVVHGYGDVAVFSTYGTALAYKRCFARGCEIKKTLVNTLRPDDIEDLAK